MLKLNHSLKLLSQILPTKSPTSLSHSHLYKTTPNHLFNSSQQTHSLSHAHFFNSSRPLRYHHRPVSGEVLRFFGSKCGVSRGVVLMRSQFQFQRQRFETVNEYNWWRRRWRSWIPTTENAVWGLISANAFVFVLWRYADPTFMRKNFMISLDNFKNGRLHTLITSAFSHIESRHLFSNMIGLYFFGNAIGRSFGPVFLLKLYLAGAVGGSVFYLVQHALMFSSSKVILGLFLDQAAKSFHVTLLIYQTLVEAELAITAPPDTPAPVLGVSLGSRMWYRDPSQTPGLGASGAVNAILLLHIFLYPTAIHYLNFFIPVPAMLLGAFFIGKDVMLVIEGNSHISGSAHLGGAVVAALAWARIKRGWI
ncbi:hypothetical protein GIB67_036289 [Kingdonia uniflora]|uniref:Peptidase S54 rhomboid domain-containing protein n=1 Tax=Kingdonia uniflora TaxID=39325 RepID=A0A7J7L3V9_9MAGN|nr:hypothetical protein GIB67_036289 [Kingdonia uniflora]